MKKLLLCRWYLQCSTNHVNCSCWLNIHVTLQLYKGEMSMRQPLTTTHSLLAVKDLCMMWLWGHSQKPWWQSTMNKELKTSLRSRSLIHPRFPGLKWLEDWCKAFLSTAKTLQPLWLISTRGPSYLGSLPSGDTGKSVSPGKQGWTKGRDPREGFNSFSGLIVTNVVDCDLINTSATMQRF